MATFTEVPPWCRPWECSDIYDFSTLIPSLSYINTGTGVYAVTGATGFGPDSIRTGFEITNHNMLVVKQTLQSFSDVYGKYRQNLALTYSMDSFYAPSLTADPPTSFSRPVEVGDMLYFMASSEDYPIGAWNYSWAATAQSEALGMVSHIHCNNGVSCFTLTLNGYVSAGKNTYNGLLVPGANYFLHHSTPGKMQLGNLTWSGVVSKPVATAISNTEFIVDIKRGVLTEDFDIWP